MCHIYIYSYFNTEGAYYEENTCENAVFCSTIFHHRKKLNIGSAVNVLHTVLE